MRDNGFAGHLSTANYLFADGHVKSLRPTATVVPLNMWGQVNDGLGGVCGDYSWNINCDTLGDGLRAAMQLLQAKYN